MKKKLKPIESYIITRPTSAFTVLGRVITLVSEDYKRLRMGATLLKDNSISCGTVGCTGGWTHFVLGRSLDFVNLFEIAHLLFPNTERGYAEFRDGCWSGSHFWTPDGTPEQVEAVVGFLKDIRRRYAEDLKQTILRPGGKA